MDTLEKTSDILFFVLYTTIVVQYVVTVMSLPVLPYVVLMCQMYLFYAIHRNNTQMREIVIRNISSLPCVPP